MMTPCAVCATKAQLKASEFFATRGLDWPLTEVAGHRVHKACESEAEHLDRAVARGELVIDGAGVGRWISNGHAIPADCAALAVALGLAPGLDSAATAAASAAEAAAAIAAYRSAQPAEVSGEELWEMRAAFGPGAEVVNVITGRRTQL